MDLSVNETNIQGLDDTPNIDHIKRVVDGRDPPTNCDPLDGYSIRPVPPPSLFRQGPNPLGGVRVPNGSRLYGVNLALRRSVIHLSDSSHSIIKKIAHTAIGRKYTGGVSALVEVAKSSGKLFQLR